MDGEQRRAKIIELLSSGGGPVSGAALAKKLGVSRQVIVQDIALLRATDKNILSTNKGYIIFENDSEHNKCRRIIAVKHADEEMQDELYTIVDAGAKIKDVIVEHDVYGQIAVDLLISSRKDVDEFIKKIQRNKMRPLKDLTGDKHYHTIEADNDEELNLAVKNLQKSGYLI